MTDEAQPDTGPASEGVLDFDQAAAEMLALEQRPDEEAQDEEITADEAVDETEADPAEDSDADPDEATADADDDEGDDTEAKDPPIQPPHSWDKEAKERFSKLDRETQEYLVNRENERDRAVSQKLNEAAETRKAAEEASSKLAQYAQAFDQVLTNAQQRFADKWANTDWQRLANESPADYVRAQEAFKADQQALAQTQKAQQAAEMQAHQQFLQQEGKRLKEIAPDLADPKKGGERKRELAKFLSEQGVDAEAMKWASAHELGLAYDAMRWRKAQAETTKPKPVEKRPAPKSVRPGAEAKTKPRTAKQREAAIKRLGQTGSVDDAAAAILALSGES